MEKLSPANVTTPAKLPAPRAAAAAPAAAAAGIAADSLSTADRPEAPTNGRPASLTDAQTQQVAKKKATCPFIGSAVATHALPVRNSAEKPLGSIDDVVALGNTGGGDLGYVLKLFATGNHAFMAGASGKLDTAVPAGLFSLDFPGSQGSHPGHSGILQGDPTQLDSGRLSQADLDRLLSKAKNGYLKRSDVAHFIAENLIKDPHAKVLDRKTVGLLAGDAGGVARQTGPALLEHLGNHLRSAKTGEQERKLVEKLTKNLGEDNLIGSAGEYGLLLAFLAHSPRAKTINGELAVPAADVKAMFADHQFPEGWETWPKTAHDWVVNTTALTLEAGKAYHQLKKAR